MKIKKILLSLSFIAIFGAYVFYVKYNPIDTVAIIDNKKQNINSVPVVNNLPQQSNQPTNGNVIQSIINSTEALIRRGGDDGNENDDEGGSINQVPQNTTQVTPPVSTPKPTPTPTPSPTPSPATQVGMYKNGTYTGQAADAFYGLVQVRVTISGGKISSVAFLQYPSDNSTSLRKSNMAMPILKTEAIQAQSSNVNTVSGATATSDAFIQSLSSALSQAT